MGGIDSLNGDIVWRYFHDGLHGMNIKLYLQRTAAHADPIVALLATKAGQTTVLLHVDPITGRVQDKSDEIAAGSRIIQASLLPNADENFVKPLVLLDADVSVCVDFLVGRGVLVWNFYVEKPFNVLKNHICFIFSCRSSLGVFSPNFLK